MEAFRSEPAVQPSLAEKSGSTVQPSQAESFNKFTLDDLTDTTHISEDIVGKLKHRLEVLQRPDVQEFLQPFLQKVEQFLHDHADYLRDNRAVPEIYFKQYVSRVLDHGSINQAISGPNPRLEDIQLFLNDALMKGLENMESWFDQERAMADGVNIRSQVFQFQQQLAMRLLKKSYAA